MEAAPEPPEEDLVWNPLAAAWEAPAVGVEVEVGRVAFWLGAAVADGMGAELLAKGTTFDLVELKSVAAIPISLLDKS